MKRTRPIQNDVLTPFWKWSLFPEWTQRPAVGVSVCRDRFVLASASCLWFHMDCLRSFPERRRGQVKGGSQLGAARARSNTVLYHISGHLHNRQKQNKIKLNKVRVGEQTWVEDTWQNEWSERRWDSECSYSTVHFASPWNLAVVS